MKVFLDLQYPAEPRGVDETAPLNRSSAGGRGVDSVRSTGTPCSKSNSTFFLETIRMSIEIFEWVVGCRVVTHNRTSGKSEAVRARRETGEFRREAVRQGKSRARGKASGRVCGGRRRGESAVCGRPSAGAPERERSSLRPREWVGRSVLGPRRDQLRTSLTNTWVGRSVLGPRGGPKRRCDRARRFTRRPRRGRWPGRQG
jgi:hypothetical protein